MTHIVTVTSQKGGVTKTTTAVNLAGYFADLGFETMLIDFDPQGQAATSLGLDPAPGIFAMFVQEQPAHLYVDLTDRANLSIIRGNQRTKQAVNFLNQSIAAGDVDRQRLAQTLLTVCRPFEYVVIDTPASGILQEVALQAARTVVIPVSLDYLGMDGLTNTLATIAKLERTDLRTIILPTMQQNTGDSRHHGQLLADAALGCIAQPVPHSVAVREAVAQGKTVWEYEDSRSETLRRVCTAYEHLAELIMEVRS